MIGDGEQGTEKKKQRQIEKEKKKKRMDGKESEGRNSREVDTRLVVTESFCSFAAS